MPVDRKRISGPEETQSPLLFVKQSEETTPLIKTDGKREDGRLVNDIRPIFIKSGVVSQAPGSAYIEMARTKVICAVYGPREVLRREDFSMNGVLKCDFKFATFSCPARRNFQADEEEKEFSLLIQQALSPAVCLHKFPKSQVDIFVKVLENDGSALAASIICSSVALADAAIEMYDVVTACSLRITETDLLMDPTYQEESSDCRSDLNGTITMGYLPSLNQTSALLQRGHATCDRTLEAIRLCTEGCQRVYPLVHQCLSKSVRSKHRVPPKPDGDRGHDPKTDTKD